MILQKTSGSDARVRWDAQSRTTLRRTLTDVIAAIDGGDYASSQMNEALSHGSSSSSSSPPPSSSVAAPALGGLLSSGSHRLNWLAVRATYAFAHEFRVGDFFVASIATSNGAAQILPVSFCFNILCD